MRGRGPAAGHLERHRLRDPQLVDGGLPLCAEEEWLAAAEPTILLAVRVEVERRVEGGARAVDEQHYTLMDESKDADAKAAPARMACALALLPSGLVRRLDAFAARPGAEQRAADEAERRLELRRLAAREACALVEP